MASTEYDFFAALNAVLASTDDLKKANDDADNREAMRYDAQNPRPVFQQPTTDRK